MWICELPFHFFLFHQFAHNTLSHSFAYSDGFNSSPLPFPCDITPRSPQHVKVIQDEFRDAMGKLKVYNSS